MLTKCLPIVFSGAFQCLWFCPTCQEGVEPVRDGTDSRGGDRGCGDKRKAGGGDCRSSGGKRKSDGGGGGGDGNDADGADPMEMSDDGSGDFGGDFGGGGSSDGDVDDGYGSAASNSSSTGPTASASFPVDSRDEDGEPAVSEQQVVN